ncbi:MAG: DUF3592 domain-containing protein [Oscillospiraceae bacterium]
MTSEKTRTVSRHLGTVAGVVAIFIGASAVLLGIIFIIVAVTVTTVGKKSTENYLPVEATIKEIIDSYNSSNDSYDKRPYVEYEVDGQTYSAVLNYYTSSMYKGQKIEILYDPENPLQTSSEDTFKIISFVFGLIGGIFLVAGLIPMIIGIIATVKLSKAPKLSAVGAEEASPADYSKQYNKNDDDRYGGLGEGIE